MGKIKHLFRIAFKKVRDTSPVWMTILSGAGVIGTGYFSAKDTRRYLEELAKIGPDAENTLSKKELWKLRGKCYWRTVACGGATIGCMSGATAIGWKQKGAALAGMAAATRLSENLRAAAKDIVGKDKADEIETEAAKKSIETNPISVEKCVKTGKGDIPVRDITMGGDFLSCKNTIEAAEVEILRQLYSDIDVEQTLNEFRYQLGLEAIHSGNWLGWRTGQEPNVRIKSLVNADGVPILTIEYDIYPLFDNSYKNLRS